MGSTKAGSRRMTKTRHRDDLLIGASDVNDGAPRGRRLRNKRANCESRSHASCRASSTVLGSGPFVEFSSLSIREFFRAARANYKALRRLLTPKSAFERLQNFAAQNVEHCELVAAPRRARRSAANVLISSNCEAPPPPTSSCNIETGDA